MSALTRKLFRDLWHMRGQAVAISLVLACGVGTFVMSLSTLASLEFTQAAYYDRYHFADAFARLKRAPNALADRVAEVPGVARVQTRVVVDVTLDVPNLKEPASGRIISVPERPTPMLNELHLRRGRRVEPGQRGEVLVNEAFADAHKLQPGHSIRVVVNGRRQSLHIVGVALSPEYIYPIREGEIIPDNRRYGIFWMGREELAAAYNMTGAFNDLTMALTPGASQAEVLRQVDQLIEPYGGLGAFGREDQTSNKFITNEIAQLRASALIAPSIFLGVAAFLLNIAVTRIVGAQREQIAMLKAFGYGRWAIAGHYLGLVGILVGVGLILGTAIGAWLGYDTTRMYAQFFLFPAFDYRLDLSVILWGLVISGGAALAGTIGAIRSAARLPPAEAMRPEPPARYRPVLLERVVGRWLTPVARMTLRNLARRPVRSSLTGLGMAMAVAILVLGNFVEDAVNEVIDFQFFATQKQDVTVAFIEPASPRVLSALRHLPGVQTVEPFRGVAVRIRHENRSRRIGLQGRWPEALLSQPHDARTRRPVELPPEGLVVSAKLAEVLGVAPGDTVTVEVLEGERPVRDVPIRAIYYDYAEPSALMRIDALNRLLREGDTYSGAHLAVEADRIDDLYAQLKEAPRVAGVLVKRLALKSFEEILAESLLRIKAINLAFAAVIAFGVVYNSARIALAERGRDLATLRVLGFTRGEIAAILLGELGVLTVAAVPVGLGIGFGMVWLAATALDTETQRFPAVVGAGTCGFAVAVTLLAAVLSGLVVRRSLTKLDLVAVLKSRE